MVSTLANVQVTTTETMPGYRIEKVLGPVVGVAARSSSPYSEGLKSTKDGSAYAVERRRDILTQCRLEAVEQMIERAWHMGGNAVVAMRFDHRDVTESWNEICAYGTAVWIEQAGQVAVSR